MVKRKNVSPIVYIVNNLFTNMSAEWIIKLEDNEIQPFVIQRWMVMVDGIRTQTRWLDKYVFVLPPKMYLSLAWTIIPKVRKTPFINYIKKVSEEEEYEFILSKVRKHFSLSDNDYNSVKGRLISTIKNDKVNWFSYYGVPKKYWKQHYINFNLIKEFGEENKPAPQKGLDAWGL